MSHKRWQTKTDLTKDGKQTPPPRNSPPNSRYFNVHSYSALGGEQSTPVTHEFFDAFAPRGAKNLAVEADALFLFLWERKALFLGQHTNRCFFFFCFVCCQSRTLGSFMHVFLVFVVIFAELCEYAVLAPKEAKRDG